MNVYDEAHNLERAIRESQEFKDFDAAREKVKANPDLDHMLKDFAEKQIAIQAKQMMGEEVGPEAMEAVQKLYGIIASDPLAAEYLQTQMRFTIMMQDVYKILGETAGLGME